ncbi:hypothetical protein AB0D74_30510 [Streptomyces sp. NPDC048278]|uniref:hypothetical protein n=1 Tax=Streptomyces sp. NPDC048278 TaxID=3155809 RepID=UPI003448B6DB
MTQYNGTATAVTEAGEAPVRINVREVPDGIRDPYWAGTMTIRAVEIWQAIANHPEFGLRLPDGRVGTWQAAEGAGLPPTETNPTTFPITRVDGVAF